MSFANVSESTPDDKMINLVRGIWLLVQRRDRVGHEVDGHDIDFIVGRKGSAGSPAEKNERADHIELVGFGTAAVTQNDAGTEISCAERREASCRTMCSQNFFVRAYGS